MTNNEQTGFKQCAYNGDQGVAEKKPLMIGCSGGGGHIAAIKGISGYFEKNFPEALNLPDYTPVGFEQKRESAVRDQIRLGGKVMYAPLISAPIRATISLSNLPILPDADSLNEEIYLLSRNNSSKRKYVDMLLDVYPAGYESAAIWNALQRKDKIRDLKKLINLQSSSDKENHDVVYNYYLNMLKEAAQQNSPYTEVISTQAMALPALCDAVKDYNNWLDTDQDAPKDALKVVIHQYMTDLPTEGAIHFFKPLSRLKPEQQQQMKLYGVGMHPAIMQNFFQEDHYFAGVFDIPADNNPMVRPGFKDLALDKSHSFEQEVTLTLSGETTVYKIEANEQIASIMLGSQAGNDSYEYIEDLLKNGINKVFVFGGQTNPSLNDKIANLVKQHDEYQSRIIPLENQTDIHIAPLMSRSNMLIIRGGGLSVMEQLAMKHNPEQTVLIHHANSKSKELTSGISWEDSNVESLMSILKNQGVHTKKTSPKRANRHITEARLISRIKKYKEGDKDHHGVVSLVQSLSNQDLKHAVEMLVNSEEKTFKDAISAYFTEREEEAERHVQAIGVILCEIETKMKEMIEKERLLDSKNRDQDLDNERPLINKKRKDKLDKLLKAHQAIEDLQATLKSDGSASKRLMEFKEKYDACIEELSSVNSSIIQKYLQRIRYRLARYFHYFEKKLTSEQKIQKILNQTESPKLLLSRKNPSAENQGTFKPK